MILRFGGLKQPVSVSLCHLSYFVNKKGKKKKLEAEKSKRKKPLQMKRKGEAAVSLTARHGLIKSVSLRWILLCVNNLLRTTRRP